MRDLRWDDVKEWFDPHENGSVPDLVVADTSLPDWQALLTLVRSHGWPCTYEVGGQPVALPSSATDLFVSGQEGRVRSLRVWPHPDIEIIFRPWSIDEIVGDISLHEVQGQKRLDTFCGTLRMVGRAVDKRVALYAEGGGDHPPILAYEVDQDRVVFLVRPWVKGRHPDLPQTARRHDCTTRYCT
jgi:hypothetical protein